MIDLTARLYNLSPKEAAEKLAQDFGLIYDGQAPPRRYVRQKTETQKFQENRDHAFRVLADYFHLLRKWETGYIKTLRTDKMQKLSNALGTSVDYLMGWTDNSVNVGTVGTNNGVIGQNSGEIHLEQQRSKEEAELLRIFSGLDVKRRMELLMTAIRLDEEQNQ